MLRVGLTGGLASGKTFVGKTLESLGCHLIQADELGHEVLLPGGEAYQPVIDEFGVTILDENGRIDRRKLGALVFDDPAKLARLSAFVHPAVVAREEALLKNIVAEDPRAIVVVEAAILVETGSYRRFDRLIVAVCAPEQQMQRAIKRDVSSEAAVAARLSRQLPLEEKKRVAHFIIDTSGSKQNTIEQTRAVYDALRSIEP
jgi:dephospho-CoA kinase